MANDDANYWMPGLEWTGNGGLLTQNTKHRAVCGPLFISYSITDIYVCTHLIRNSVQVRRMKYVVASKASNYN